MFARGTGQVAAVEPAVDAPLVELVTASHNGHATAVAAFIIKVIEADRARRLRGLAGMDVECLQPQSKRRRFRLRNVLRVAG